MAEVGVADPELFILAGDISVYALRDFAAKCPGRFFNIGTREQSMCSAGAGLALVGFIPVIHSITPFVVERCFEQIKDDFCYQRLPGNIVSVGAGFDYAALGGTHHCYSDIALIKSLPRTQVFYAGSPIEFDQLFKQVYRSGYLNYFRVAGRAHGVSFGPDDIVVGRSIRAREGQDATLVCAGPLLDFALAAAEEVRPLSLEVIYSPSIKPFDAENLRQSVQKTKRVIIAEDHSSFGGLADEARRALDGLGCSFQIKSLGINGDFIHEYGSFDHLADHVGLGKTAIANAARQLCSP